MRFSIVEDGEEVGEVRLRDAGHSRLAYVEWHVDHEARGRGVATHAVKDVIGTAFRFRIYHRIVAVIRPSNAASIRVAEKAGMRYEGTSVRSRLIDGVWEDALFYAITEEEHGRD